MSTKSIILSAAALLWSAGLEAEVVIKRYPGPLPERTIVQEETGASLRASGLPEKIENPTTFYILPFYKIDAADPNGETTFLSIRNEETTTQDVTVFLFAPNSAADPVIRVNALLPKETWVLNLRGIPTHPADLDGFYRGWGRLVSTGRISSDFFQFNPSQDFATGAQPIDIDGGELCETVKTRFLVGGTFDGGTLLTLMMDSPLGGDPETDPPSVTGTVYLEDSTMAGTFEIYSNRFSIEVNAEDLLMPGVNFGSMDIVFENNFGGGLAFTEFKANNRFSVGLKSVCLDTP